jgi:hypothetical protein
MKDTWLAKGDTDVVGWWSKGDSFAHNHRLNLKNRSFLQFCRASRERELHSPDLENMLYQHAKITYCATQTASSCLHPSVVCE